MTLEEVERFLGAKLDEVLTNLQRIDAILKRIEERQIKTTAAVMEVKEHEAPVVGSFGSSDLGSGAKE